MMEMLWPHPDDMPDCWYPAITQWMVRLNRTLAPFGWTLQVRPRRGCGWRLVPYQKEHDMSRREDQALAMLRARRFCTPLEIGRAATRGEVRANRLTNTDRQRIGLEVIAVLLKAGKVKVARRSEGHTSELQSLMRNSYAVFCLKKNNQIH